jgi:plastocyanin
MMMRTLSYGLVLSTLLLMLGCERHAGPTQVTTQPVHGQGSIRGKVTLAGDPPPESTDPAIKNVVLVSPDHGLRNVVVSIAANTEPAASGLPMIKMDQIDYQFVPRVVAVQVGQKLEVHSSDHAIHNVRMVAKRNPSVNDVLHSAGDMKDYVFQYPETIGLKCDVHPWMSAWITIFDHPFFSVTDENGNFEIKGLKPGTYELTAFHELYGPKIQSITVVTEDEPTVADFEFVAPSK